MSAVPIFHEVEGLAQLDEAVDQPLCSLEVDVARRWYLGWREQH